MLSKGIDTTIRELIEQMPKSGTSGSATTDFGEFEKLIAPLAAQISSAIIAAQAQAQGGQTSTSGTVATTPLAPTTAPTGAAGASPQSRLNAFQYTLLRDRESPMFEQLPGTLTAGDSQYNLRENAMRQRLDIDELESRLKSYARSFEVSYDVSDLEGVLRNAGYDAAHFGSSERYMNAIEHFVDEAKKNYSQRAGNTPGQNA